MLGSLVPARYGCYKSYQRKRVGPPIRFIVTGVDVIHSFGVPSLGIKMDSIPGRLNQTGVTINREGVFYGSCFELCGVYHSAMPIVIQSVSLPHYLAWVSTQLSS